MTVHQTPGDLRPSQPVRTGGEVALTFGMRRGKMTFTIGTQSFALDYEPTEPGEFEFMQAMLTKAIGRASAMSLGDVSVPNETASGATQQDHPKGLKTTDPVVLAVIAKFDERSRIGIDKYGTTLARTDLSLIDWLRHALEEQMDNVLYLTRAINELEQGR